MNLREQIEKEITDKVMTKLASEKVELGLIDDLEKLQQEYSKIAIAAIQEKSKLQGSAKKLSSDLEKAKKAIESAQKKNEILKSAAKNIGIQVPDISKKVDQADNFNVDRLLKWAQKASQD